MNILTLSIKQAYFDQIRAGTKKKEIREVRPSTEKRYVVLNEAREITDIIKYDAIKFLTGAYAGTRPSMLVEVKEAHLEEVHDENDQPIMYEENGQQNMMIDIVYRLGKILKS
jgi:hypothetical protein